MRAAAVPFLAALLFASAEAAAQAKNGDPIESSDYTLDLYDGPVLAGSRVIGLGGAYVAVADGIAGYEANPAAVAHRVPWSVDWFDWELDGGITLPASLENGDFDNNGRDGFTNAAQIFLMGGGGIQFGDWGAGMTVDFHQYRVISRDPATAGEPLDMNLTRVLLVGGHAFFDGQLSGGLGLEINNVDIHAVESATQDQSIATVTGPALHLGALWAPYPLPIRVGASVRLALPASATPDSKPEGATETSPGVFTAGGYVLPRTVSLPTEVRAGVAFQLFRPLNFRWRNVDEEAASAVRQVKREIAAATERRARSQAMRREQARAAGADPRSLEELFEREDERAKEDGAKRLADARRADRARRRAPYRAMAREKVLVSTEVKLTAITTDGVGLESFLLQRVQRSGEEVAVSPRLGVEAEVIPGYLVLRGGSYYEPTRFTSTPEASARMHATGGLDVRIPIEWSVFGLLDDDTTFRVGGAVDGASRYFGWAASAGLWH